MKKVSTIANEFDFNFVKLMISYNFYMINFAPSQLVFIEEFVNFCKKNDIWYSVDEKTLLYLLSNNKELSNENYFMVMMTWHSYSRLKRLKPLNVIDTINNNRKQKTLYRFYVNEKSYETTSQNSSKLIIKIRIVVPTTIERVKKFNNFFYYIIGKIFGYQINLNNAVNFLYQKQNNGFLWLDQRFKKIETNWSPTIDFTTIEIPFAYFKVAIVQNSLELLKMWFESQVINYNFPTTKQFTNGDK